LDELVNLGSIFYTIDALTNCIIPVQIIVLIVTNTIENSGK